MLKLNLHILLWYSLVLTLFTQDLVLLKQVQSNYIFVYLV